MTASSSLSRVSRRAGWTAAPAEAKWVVLFDGNCRFCVAQVKRLQRTVGRSRVEPVSFQEPGVLERFPGIEHAACMQRMHVVRPDGRVFVGAEGLARVVALVPVVGWLAFGYYVPGLRQLANAAYAIVARVRYRIAGRTGECGEGTCSLHR